MLKKMCGYSILIDRLKDLRDGEKDFECVDREMNDIMIRWSDFGRDHKKIFRMWDKIKTGEKTVDETLEKLEAIHRIKMREQDHRNHLDDLERKFKEKFREVNKKKSWNELFG